MKKFHGFSLIEVLMLFAALSVILAATAPMLTKQIKNVPTKMPHGLYQCYRDKDGNLHEEWYNTFRRVSLTTPDKCTFTPPPVATMFKITLIGGGSGGYSYGYVSEKMKPYTTYYRLYGRNENEHYVEKNNLYRNLTETELSTLFKGEKVVACSYKASDGGDACGVKQYFYSTQELYCTGRQSQPEWPNLNSYLMRFDKKDAYEAYYKAVDAYKAEMSKIREAEAKLKVYNTQAYKDQDSVQTGVSKTYSDLCKEAGYTGAAWRTTSSTTGDYGRGGKGKYLKWSIEIPAKGVGPATKFSKYWDMLNAYSLETSITRGSVYSTVTKYNSCTNSSTVCSGFVASAARLTNGADCSRSQAISQLIQRGPIVTKGNDPQNNSSTNPNANIKPANGGDATGSAVLRWQHPNSYPKISYMYKSTGKPANGGTFGEVYWTHSSGTTSWNAKDGTDGTSNTGADSSLLSDTCDISDEIYGNGNSNGSGKKGTQAIGEIIATRMVKYYTVGKAGNPGSVEHYTKFGMGKEPCEIYVGKGTKGHESKIEKLDTYKNIVSTTLSCQGFKLTALGGQETNATEDLEVAVADSTEPYSTNIAKPSDEAKEPQLFGKDFDYSKLIFWLKHVADPGISFGKAGEGSKLYDACFWPQGEQVYKIKGQEDAKGVININQELKVKACKSSDYYGEGKNKEITAGDGLGGAVIIRW